MRQKRRPGRKGGIAVVHGSGQPEAAQVPKLPRADTAARHRRRYVADTAAAAPTYPAPARQSVELCVRSRTSKAMRQGRTMASIRSSFRPPARSASDAKRAGMVRRPVAYFRR